MPPGLATDSKFIQGRLHFFLFPRDLTLVRVSWNRNRTADYCDSSREGQRYLQPVPAWQCDISADGDVKRENREPGMPSQRDRPFLCDIGRPAWSIDRERGIDAARQALRQFYHR